MDPHERIPLLEGSAAVEAAAGSGVPEAFARLNVFRAFLRHPALASQLAAMLQTLLSGGAKLDPRLRELAIMRIAWRTGSMYEWTQHWRVALNLGLPEEDVLTVKRWPAAAGLCDADRAVLQATDDTLDQGMIGDSTWAACRRHLPSPDAQIELVVALGNWIMFSQILRTLRVPLEEGVAPWPPDGHSPDAETEATA